MLPRLRSSCIKETSYGPFFFSLVTHEKDRLIYQYVLFKLDLLNNRLLAPASQPLHTEIESDRSDCFSVKLVVV